MSHALKQRALEAYAAGLLSVPGRRRLEAHLARCASCRTALGAVRAYALLREQAEEEPAPEPSWERLERALSGAAERAPARSGRVLALAWPVLAIAATLFIAWLGTSGMPDAAPQPRAQTPSAPVLAVIGRVTLIAGTAQLELGSRSSPIDLSSEIREGSLLVTGRGAELHVALGPETGFVLGPESRLRVVELRTLRTRLELVVGQLGSRVKRLSGDEQYRVLAGELTASVRGTRFTVEQGRGTRVSVHEGLVEVSRGGQTLALLAPGQSFADPARATPAPHDVSVHMLEHALDELHALHLPPMPALRNWRVDGGALSAQGALSMRLPRGTNRLEFEDLRGQMRSVEIEVADADTRLDALTLTKLIAPREPPRVGRLEPEQIVKVIKAGLDPLRRCYEHSLHSAPALEAKLTLAVRVGADGRVQRAEAHGAQPLPAALEGCIAREAGRLLFPKPDGGGSMTFEVPLNLKAK